MPGFENFAGNDLLVCVVIWLVIPVQLQEIYVRQLVEPAVVLQERLTEGMIVAGCDIGTAILQSQAGQAQTAAQLQNASIFQVHGFNETGQHFTGRPELAKQAPAGRADAGTFGSTIRV